jgi:hypothetical protein
MDPSFFTNMIPVAEEIRCPQKKQLRKEVAVLLIFLIKPHFFSVITLFFSLLFQSHVASIRRSS